jgi:protein SCO1/2
MVGGWQPAARAAAPAPAFTSASLAGLVDGQGRTLPANPWPGRYQLVLFGFASCADVCPLTLLALRESLKLLGQDAARVVPVFISVDPERDRGEALARYVRAFDARIQGLTGPQAVVQRVAGAHGVFFEKRWVDVSNNAYVFDHTASVLVIGPDGKLVATVSSAGPPAEVAKRVVAAIPKANP